MTDLSTKVLQDVAAGLITPSEGAILLKKQQEKTKGVILKVTPKGCIGIYGLRRMPISIYYTELTSILNYVLSEGWEYSDDMNTFLKENDDRIKKTK
uniref:Uncharacterized protein n=1 Tax=viral metagenome TaxID=1070528 RepID=A0A6C0JA37_9ZZZZ